VAAAFDCAKALSQIERLICGDKQLSVLDDKLISVYKSALDSVDPASRSALVQEQRNWVNYTRGSCDEVSCLHQVYLSRIAQLSQNDRYIVNSRPSQVTLDGELRNVVFQRDPNGRVVSFNKSLSTHEIAGNIIVCQRLVDLAVGIVSGNNSYGGYCTLEKGGRRTPVEICDDNLIGHFAVRSISTAAMTDEGLVRFTSANCFGG
jgi:hypothetical protein